MRDTITYNPAIMLRNPNAFNDRAPTINLQSKHINIANIFRHLYPRSMEEARKYIYASTELGD
jgi:hypothetical protein